MLLAIDIGNTNIKFAVFDGETLVVKRSVPTASTIIPTGFEAPAELRGLKNCSDAIVCSVVPQASSAIRDLVFNTLQIEPVFVTNDFDFGLTFNYEPLAAVGTDRLVNVFAAAEKYGPPLIVGSFGTALTLDVVNENRVVPGGVIAPGFAMVADVLHEKTAQLPKIEIRKPQTLVQKTTIGAMQSGIVYGYFGLADALIAGIKREVAGEVKVIATGGFGSLVADGLPVIDLVDENLLLDGLRILYSRLS